MAKLKPCSVLVMLLMLLRNISQGLPDFWQAQNVLFNKEAIIHISAHAWTISFPLDTLEYIGVIHKLYEATRIVLTDYNQRSYIPISHNDSVTETYHGILENEYHDFYNLFVDISTLHDKLTNTTRLCVSTCTAPRRDKRSLLPFVGSIFEVFFGTATKNKENTIESHLRQPNSENAQSLHAVADSLTVLAATTDAVTKKRELLNNLTDVTLQLEEHLIAATTVIQDIILPF